SLVQSGFLRRSIDVPDDRRLALCLSARDGEAGTHTSAIGGAARSRFGSTSACRLPVVGATLAFQPARHLSALSRARRVGVVAIKWVCFYETPARLCNADIESAGFI